jgi:hypothetical protein
MIAIQRTTGNQFATRRSLRTGDTSKAPSTKAMLKDGCSLCLLYFPSAPPYKQTMILGAWEIPLIMTVVLILFLVKRVARDIDDFWSK